jgi:branched-chain amino acid transport system substrate-binding protein
VGVRCGVLAAAASVLALAGCSGGDEAGADEPVTVYASLPLRGPSGADGSDAADGARLALAEAGGVAGDREVALEILDDTEGPAASARWSPVSAAENARTAIQDSSAIAYVGDFESGATRTSLPITNEARMLQVSPASAAPDLVREAGTFDDVPEEVQPSGERTFGRVIPSDEAQAAVAAVWAQELGARTVSVRDDGSTFGEELAEAFTAAAESRGVSIDRSGAGLIYLAGDPDPSGGRELGSDVYLFRPPTDRPLFVTSAALAPSQLPTAGQEFAQRFRERFDREPGRYAAYGYEAMAVVLDSIERAGAEGGSREAVTDAFLDTSDRDSVLGTYSIDEVGETTLDRLTGYRLEGERATPVAELTASG